MTDAVCVYYRAFFRCKLASRAEHTTPTGIHVYVRSNALQFPRRNVSLSLPTMWCASPPPPPTTCSGLPIARDPFPYPTRTAPPRRHSIAKARTPVYRCILELLLLPLLLSGHYLFKAFSPLCDDSRPINYTYEATMGKRWKIVPRGRRQRTRFDLNFGALMGKSFDGKGSHFSGDSSSANRRIGFFSECW